MTISKVKPSGWATNDNLKSSEMNAIDTALTRALDKTSAGDTLSGAVNLAGAGRIIPSVAPGPDAATAITVGSNNTVYQLTSAITADRVYTLQSTGAATGDTITIFANSDFTRVVSVRASSAPTTDIYKIGNVNTADGAWATFIYMGQWRLYQHAIGSRMKREEFLANGTWTCPAGVTSVLLYGYGGGGAGGVGGQSTATLSCTGGGGGGGALGLWVNVSVTPGTTYTVTIGSGGVSSAVYTGGDTGTETKLTVGASTSATFPGAFGGANGFTGNAGTANKTTAGGAPNQYNPYTTTVVETTKFSSQYVLLPHVGGNGGIVSDSYNTVTLPAGRGGAGLSETGYLWTGGSGGTSSAAWAQWGGSGGGGGGGAGPAGAGGTGGNDGAAGTAAAANSGAGGGGGGGDQTGLQKLGGNGGSGKLVIVYVK